MNMGEPLDQSVIEQVQRGFTAWSAIYKECGWKVELKHISPSYPEGRVVIESVFCFETTNDIYSIEMSAGIDLCSIVDLEADVNRAYYGTIESLDEAWTAMPSPFNIPR